jgi:hypothetical protein
MNRSRKLPDMTFSKAKEFRDNCLYLIDSSFPLPDFPYTVEHLIIAPSNRTAVERMKIFAVSMNGINANEAALRKFNFLEEDLEVYVIGVFASTWHDKALTAYLAETNQVPFA